MIIIIMLSFTNPSPSPRNPKKKEVKNYRTEHLPQTLIF